MQVIVSTLKSSAGWTSPIQLDYQKLTAVSVQTVVNTTGAGLTYNVEYSLDPLSTSSSLMTWFTTGSSNISTNAFITLSTPIRALRFNITAGTSNTALTGTVIESFI